jgi:integrase
MSEALELYLARPNLAENTRKSYIRMFNLLLTWKGNKPIEEVSQADLMRFIAHEQSKGAAPRSINLMTNFLKAIFSWLWRNEYLEKSPAARLENLQVAPIPDHERAISAREWMKLKQFARDSSVRDYAILAFMMDSACRVSAAALLRLGGLDIPNLRAFGYEPKIKSRVEWNFGEECAIALEAWLAERQKLNVNHDFVFASTFTPYPPLKAEAIRTMMKRSCVKAGIAVWTPHALRHAEIQFLAQQPGVTLLDVQSKANHKSAKTTMDSYFPQRSKRLGELSRRYSLVDDDKPKQPEAPMLRVLPKSS